MFTKKYSGKVSHRLALRYLQDHSYRLAYCKTRKIEKKGKQPKQNQTKNINMQNSEKMKIGWLKHI